MTDQQFNERGKIWLALAFILVLVLVALNSCSSVKKSLSKQSSSIDSVSVSVSSLDKETNLSTSKKVDSSGTSTKDKNKTFDNEVTIEFDSAQSQNGSQVDFTDDAILDIGKISFGQKIKKITIKSTGQKTSKESQSTTKRSIDSSVYNHNVRIMRSDSASLKKSEEIISKSKKKSGVNWIGVGVVFSLMAIAGVVLWKRRTFSKHLRQKNPLLKCS